MKILLYNPNTTQSITDKLYNTAKLVTSSGTELVPMTAKKGFPYISNEAEAQISGTTVLEVIAKEHRNYNAAIIAAFGDPGLKAARSLFHIPIVGLGEAAMLSACLFGKKFGIISFTNNMSAWYEESVETLGLKDRYAGFRAIDSVILSLDKIQSVQKKNLIKSAKDAVEIDGADVIIFAGAPLSGFKKKVEDKISVPIIDCAEAAVKQAELSVAMTNKFSNKKSYKTKLPPKKSIGLNKTLSDYISHEI